MAKAIIQVRDNGPLRILSGPITIIDMEENVIREVAEGERVGLCRCGHSGDKPFCDATHKQIEWNSVIRAADFAEVEEPS